MVQRSGDARPPDLIFALFASNHVEAYQGPIAEFEREHGVRVQMQLVHARALQSRLQAALLAGADVPDVVEIVRGSMGYFTKGPLEDVGFVDLTDRTKEEGLYDRLVQSRFSLWSSRGRLFAMPHDVHPVTLCYRRDLVEELGIDVDELETWDDFARVGRQVTRDVDGDGVRDRYMIDLPSNGAYGLQILMLQRVGGLFNEAGEVAFDNEVAADTLCWYAEQTQGPNCISFPAGWGQTLSKSMIDGLVLFYFCPDWRTKQFEMDVPPLSGKLAIMPLPAWELGGRRTSTWGGTGIAITKQCKRQKLAWEFIKFLYYDKAELGKRFADSNILPPLRDSWDLPEFDVKRPFYSDQPIGRLLANLAPDTPADFVTAYTDLAQSKLDEAFANVAIQYDKHGSEGLREYALAELKRCADYVRKTMSRNQFLTGGGEQQARSTAFRRAVAGSAEVSNGPREGGTTNPGTNETGGDA